MRRLAETAHSTSRSSHLWHIHSLPRSDGGRERCGHSLSGDNRSLAAHRSRGTKNRSSPPSLLLRGADHGRILAGESRTPNRSDSRRETLALPSHAHPIRVESRLSQECPDDAQPLPRQQIPQNSSPNGTATIPHPNGGWHQCQTGLGYRPHDRLRLVAARQKPVSGPRHVL